MTDNVKRKSAAKSRADRRFSLKTLLISAGLSRGEPCRLRLRTMHEGSQHCVHRQIRHPYAARQGEHYA